MVAKMVANAQPSGYRRSAPVARPKLEPFLAWIAETLEVDKKKHHKQRHAAKRIFEPQKRTSPLAERAK